jgi:hypothetical protein
MELICKSTFRNEFHDGNHHAGDVSMVVSCLHAQVGQQDVDKTLLTDHYSNIQIQT